MHYPQLTLYNTATQKKERFVPIKKNEVRVYSCWPTVYSRQHLWNLRAAFYVDFLRRVLHHICWYEVMHVMNVTDVWHLTGDNEWDASQWEDRMEKWARLEWVSARDVAKKYAWLYYKDLDLLHITTTTKQEDRSSNAILMTYATEHIQEQITMIKKFEEQWLTYIIPSDGVYMDTSRIENYGCLLCEEHLDGIHQWARIKWTEKKNPTDFALWKFNLTGKKRDMERESPRWVWFPWRHIECSAMAIAYLGEQFDIHTWWMEHIPVHHTNEIAQSEAFTSTSPRVKYWFHYQWLMMNNQKIAKSTGNIALMDDVIERWYTWEDMRFFYLQAQYRSFHDFTRERLDAAAKARKWLIKKIVDYYRTEQTPCVFDTNMTVQTNKYYQHLVTILCDDLATPQLLSEIFDRIKNNPNKECIEAILTLDMSLFSCGIIEGVKKWLQVNPVSIPEEIELLAQKRLTAKNNKDYALADRLREEAKKQWWLLIDTPSWQSIEPLC